MKKFLKVASLLSLVGVIGLTSGCSCSVKQDKSDERANILSETDLLFNDNVQRDFTTTYKETYTGKVQETGEDKIVTSYVSVKVDVDDKKIYLFASQKEKIGDKEEVEVVSYSHTLMMEGNVVVVKDEKNETTVSTLYRDNPYNALIASATLVESQILPLDYNVVSVDMYNTYKMVPLYGCTSGSKEENEEKAKKLPGILTNTVDTKTCDVEKKLFGKDYTYVLSYRVSVSEYADIKVVVNKHGEISSILREDTIAVGTKGQVDKRVTEYNVSFSNVD